MALKKPSQLVEHSVFDAPENESYATDFYNKFIEKYQTVNEVKSKLEIFDKVDDLSNQVKILFEKLSLKVEKSDLDDALLSQVMALDENFKIIQKQVRGINKEDINEFKTDVLNLTEMIENVVKNELPKYKNQVTKNKVYIDEQLKSIQGVADSLKDEVNDKLNEVADVIDNNLHVFNQQLQETRTVATETKRVYGNLSKLVENRINKENETLKEYCDLVDNVSKSFGELTKSLREDYNNFVGITDERFSELEVKLKEERESLLKEHRALINQTSTDYKKQIETINDYVDGRLNEIITIKSDIVINEKHIKGLTKRLDEHQDELSNLKQDTKVIQAVNERFEEVYSEIENLPIGNLQDNIVRLEEKIDYIRETYSKIEPEVIVKEVIKEGLLNEPPSANNDDPLTPLNKNFVTLEQLQEHYRLFLNRIQQQLSTIGGGGETRLKYLDDIVGIATDASSYDGKYLSYNHSLGKFEFNEVNVGPGSKTVLTDVTEDGTISYTGKASIGVSTESPQWTIYRSLFTTSGIVTSTGIARDIAWTDRYVGIYT